MTILCWIITEGIAGSENQCLGVAEALGVTPVIKRIALRQPWKTLTPILGGESEWTFSPVSDKIRAPWPDLVIASGRKSIAAARYIKRMAGNRVFTVYLQDPRISPSQFDLVAVPSHDRLRGPNVIVTTAAPNRVTPERLDEGLNDFADPFEDFPEPRVAVLIGGDSKAYKMTEAVTQKLAAQLHDLATNMGASVFITTSRRTGKANEEIIDSVLADTNAWVWDQESDNPYFGFLAWADYILVTADSVSMMSEAATTGKPVYMIQLEGGAPRINAFHKTMIDRGILRIFEGVLEPWTYPPLNDAAFVAEEIKKRLKSGVSRSF
jgi:mitochondrial fission protein ELM1